MDDPGSCYPDGDMTAMRIPSNDWDRTSEAAAKVEKRATGVQRPRPERCPRAVVA